jgi:hypothetical protein
MSLRFYYHLTNGRDLIIDRTGRHTRSLVDLETTAYFLAGQLMSRSPGGADWSAWMVSVHDRSGSMITVLPFPPGQA